MKERPSLFSGAMVRALLAGTKTQTRRVVKPQPTYQGFDGPPKFSSTFGEFHYPAQRGIRCPYGQPGDRLWVKEAILRGYCGDMDLSRYAADDMPTVADAWPWKRSRLNSIHCPRGLSRITLEITGIRVERLQDISREDAIAEGVASLDGSDGPNYWTVDAGGGVSLNNPTAQGAYSMLWESINGPGSWDANPWVWVVEFKRVMA